MGLSHPHTRAAPSTGKQLPGVAPPCHASGQSPWQGALNLEVIHGLVLVRRGRRRGRARPGGRRLRALGGRGSVHGVKVEEEGRGEEVAGRVWRRLRALTRIRPPGGCGQRGLSAHGAGSCARRAALHSSGPSALWPPAGLNRARARAGRAVGVHASCALRGAALLPEQQALGGTAGARLHRGGRGVEVGPRRRCGVL